MRGDLTGAHMLTGVGREALRFRTTVDHLLSQHGVNFPYIKLLNLDGHENLSAVNFPALSKVALLAKRANEASSSGYFSTKILSNPGCKISENEVTEALIHKRKIDRIDPEDADGIKRVCGVAAEDISSLKAGHSVAGDIETLLQMLRNATSQQ